MMKLLVLVLMLTMVFPVFAQDEPSLDVIRAYFDVSDQSPRLGAPVMLSAVVELPPGGTLVEFPDFPVQWGDFMVRETGEVTDRVLDNGWQQYRQSMIVILWDVGDFETPETLVGYTPLGQDDEVFYVPFTPVFFSVPSMLNPDMNQNTLRPLKPQIGFFYLPWWGVGAVILTTTGLGYIIRRWMIHRAKRTPVEVLPPEPHEVARVALNELRDSSPEIIFNRVPEIVRRYVMAQFDIPALEMTTDELTRYVRLYVHEETHRDTLRDLLDQADMVRFAGASSDADSATRLLDCAITWVEKIGNSTS